MGLQIVEHIGRTDVGRQRSANEDAFVVAPPFFAVADGMGGAKAGEVASQMAADAFSGEGESGEAPEAQLSRILREANRRIYELAATDESHRGMGTTLTAAKVHDSEVSLGHVGDSRAYLLRDENLEQLTRVHSLVAELERSGQLTPEAAEHHPQRSIITRALGPEPDVDVDTYTLAGRDGDVYLLCSDGLTGMLSDADVAAILRGADSLDAAAEALVHAANQSGGKDNITVVLFRLGETGDGGDSASSDDTIAGTLTADDVITAEQPSDGDPGSRTEAAPPPNARADTTMVRTPERRAPPRRPPRRRRRLARAVLRGVLALGVVAAVAAGLYALSRQVYFVGTNDAGLVTLYRGVPYDLPFGVELYKEKYASGMPARAIPRTRRSEVLNHKWRSRQDAEDLVRQLERGRLDPTGTGS
ncbi:MAG TPA: Stp1/IreP family PP2C-type Ser/Thr phosphatase [Thermoleophilaceae bacterium]